MFLYGAMVGSFLNVCIFRLPKYRTIAFERSHCLNCGALISALDNIPFFSFLILRGKCRNCQTPISWQYFLVELITAIMFVAFYLKYGLTWFLLRDLVLACLMLIIFFIDLKYQLIFDRITFSGVIMGIIFSLFLDPPGIKDSLFGVITGYMFFVFIFWFGIILLYFSDFFKELRTFLYSILDGSFFTNNSSGYFKDTLKWIIKNWDALCIPFFLTIVIGFSLGVISLVHTEELPCYSNNARNFAFLIFFFLFFEQHKEQQKGYNEQ